MRQRLIKDYALIAVGSVLVGYFASLPLTIFLGPTTALALVVSMTFYAMIYFQLSRAPHKIGTRSLQFGIGLVFLACALIPIQTVLLILFGAVSMLLVRILFWYEKARSAAFDLLWTGFSLCAALAALLLSGGVFIPMLTFLLLQSACVCCFACGKPAPVELSDAERFKLAFRSVQSSAGKR